jgi:hypothetical protein
MGIPAYEASSEAPSLPHFRVTAASSPMVSDVKIKGMSGRRWRAIVEAALPLNAGSVIADDEVNLQGIP